MMFGRFTERAQKVLALAQEEAIRLGHNNIGAWIGKRRGRDRCEGSLCFRIKP